VEQRMIFLDSSAVIAMLTEEPDAVKMAAKIEAEQERISAGHVILEASMRLATILGLAPTAADRLVTRLLREADIAVVPITEEIAHLSVAAFERFGKGRGSRASLNFGDCLSYACAKAYGARLLFKGQDFPKTDIVAA
jgi:ribonuclease VapC